MDKSGTGASPNEELASVIVDSLIAEGLIPAAREDELRQGLTSGSMKEADWRFLIEAGLPGTRQGSRDAQGD
jgi:hypothetical protein